MFERASSRLVAALLVLASGALVVSRADATGGAITLTSSSATVAPGSQVTLSAGMPVSNAGNVTQEIVQTIDPTKVKLTSIADITYPAGWSLSYCSGAATDCTVSANFSATTPANSAAWAAVKAVKAAGTVVSDGSEGGRQLATGVVSGSAVDTAPATISASGTGDGFQAFFDPARTRVFNLFHHNGSGVTEGNGKYLDCHVIATGATCQGFPFNWGGGTEENHEGTVVGTSIWIPGGTSGSYTSSRRHGMYCVDIAAVIATGGSPTMCATPYVNLGPSDTGAVHFTGGSTAGLASETKLYVLDARISPAVIYCLDTAARAPCTSASIATDLVSTSRSTDMNDILKSGDRLYVSVNEYNPSTGAGTVRVSCRLATTGGFCAGWTSTPWSQTFNGEDKFGRLYELPDAVGGVRGVCYTAKGLNADVCWNSAGTEFAASAYNMPRFADFSVFNYYGSPVRRGTRVYIGNGYYPNAISAEILCYDAAANGGLGGRCNGATGSYTWPNYTVTPDPVIENCLWVTGHILPPLRTYDLISKTAGCAGVAPKSARFPGATSVPRMGCANNSTIQGWKSFVLTSPSSGYTSATLTVENSDGVEIPGWRSVPITSGSVTLSALSIEATGQSPNFVVSVLGMGGSNTVSAQIKVVGDAPQLCLRPTVQLVCPSGLGPLSGLAGSSVSVSASGSATDSSSNTTALTPASTSVAVSAPTNAQCGATLSGTATLTGSATGVAGATVSLLDSSGNPILVNGSPVTTTTAADGTYSFGFLFPGAYKVRFADVGVKTIASTTVTGGGAGSTTDNTAATSLVSNTSTLAVGTNGVVNGAFNTPAVAVDDVSSGGQGAVQTINVKANDIAATGNNLTSPTIQFCTNDSPPSGCTLTTKSVTGQGSYSLVGGNVVFTPCSANNVPAGIGCTGAFSGVATSVGYQITDSGGQSAVATVTPTVVPLPTAAADAQTGAFDTNQTYSPAGNDTAGSGATVLASSVRLCPTTATSPFTSTNCSASSVTTADGVYTLDTATGVVTFDPVSTFTGVATVPIRYVVQDSLSQVASSTITPTVQPPGPSVAVADTSVGVAGAVQTRNLLANDTVVSGVTLSASTVKLCAANEVSPNCSFGSASAGVVVAGQGKYTVNASGEVTFTPCNGVNTPVMVPACTGVFIGQATGLSYQVTDSQNRTVSSTYTPSVAPPPTLVPDSSSGAIGVTQSAVLLVNDQPSTGTTMLSASLRLCDPRTNPAQTPNNCTVGVGSSIDIVDVGTYTVSANGVVSFTPCGTDVTANCTSGVAFVGVATPVRYQATDSLGQYGSSTYTPTVTPPTPPMFFVPSPTGPRAEPQDRAVSPGQTITFTPVLGDNGLATGDGLRSDLMAGPCLVDPASQQCGTRVEIPGEGIWTIDRTSGVVTFAADADVALGRLTPVQYRVTDRSGQTSSAALTPVVAPPGTPVDDPMSGDIDRDQRFRPIDNDTPTDEARWNPSTLRLCGAGEQSPGCDRMTLDVPGEGTYTVHLDGTIVFDPLPWFTGSATPIRYQISDSLGRTYSARLLAQVAGRGQSRHPRLPITGSDQTPAVLVVALFFVTAGSLVVGAQRRRVTSRR